MDVIATKPSGAISVKAPLFIAAATLGLGALVWTGVAEEISWNAFKAEHRCTVLPQLKAPGQTIAPPEMAKCADGLTYRQSSAPAASYEKEQSGIN